MFELVLVSIFLVPLFLLFAIASSGKSIYRPNGYMPRGGGLRTREITVGTPIVYKHGQQVRVGSLQDFLNNTCQIKYYNKYTDEFEDECN